MRALYDAELSFYVSSVFMILFWEVQRNDFAVMFTHHIVTVGLLGASLHYRWAQGAPAAQARLPIRVAAASRRLRSLAGGACSPSPRRRPRFWRVGCLVMALHDACDVLMEAAKCFNYTQRDAAATAAFAGFMVSWAALRLTAFPLMVVRSAALELPAVLGGRPPMWWGFVGGLLLLLVLHVYWFSLIVRVAWMRVVTGGGRDLREDVDS